MSDSRRLVSPGVGSALERTLLESASIPEPSAAAREAIWSSLAARLGSQSAVDGPGGHAEDHGVVEAPGPGGVSPMAARVGLPVAAKAVIAAVACLALGGALAGAIGTAGPRRSAMAASSVEPQIEQRPSVDPFEFVHVPDLDAVSATASPAAIAVAPRPPATTPRKAPGAPHPEPRPSEAASLLAARASLRAGACGPALAKLDEMASRFPGGVLVQEREAMAIEALACAGRTAEAADRAARFLRQHPSSPYADAVRARL